jgi:hypothetical protein
MKTLATILAGAALALTGATAASAETTAEKGEARLARMLEGRVAGDPVSCITPFRSDSLRIIDHVGVVYDAGKTIWVARPVNDPKALDSDDILVVERFGSQICRQDVMKTVDRYVGNLTGLVFLGDFVPYTRADG